MKKAILLLLVVGLLAVTAVACGGTGVGNEVGAGTAPPDDGATDPVVEDEDDGSLDDVDIVLPGEGDDGEFDLLITAEYFSVSGTIESVEDVDGLTHITIDDTDGNPAVLVISGDTVFPFADSFDVGDVVRGWYVTSAPMIMIWPPQYNIAVLAVDIPDDVNIKVDRFYAWGEDGMGQMISQDEMLVFTADDDTEIVLADGIEFTDGELQGRRIVVIYGMSTRSIPEITVAQKLIVLFENIVPLA